MKKPPTSAWGKRGTPNGEQHPPLGSTFQHTLPTTCLQDLIHVKTYPTREEFPVSSPGNPEGALQRVRSLPIGEKQEAPSSLPLVHMGKRGIANFGKGNALLVAQCILIYSVGVLRTLKPLNHVIQGSRVETEEPSWKCSLPHSLSTAPEGKPKKKTGGGRSSSDENLCQTERRRHMAASAFCRRHAGPDRIGECSRTVLRLQPVCLRPSSLHLEECKPQ